VFLVVVLLWFVVSVFVRFSVNKLDILFFLINILGQSFLPPFQKKNDGSMVNKSHICPYLKHSDNITEIN
jgi:hypothetical protein